MPTIFVTGTVSALRSTSRGCEVPMSTSPAKPSSRAAATCDATTPPREWPAASHRAGVPGCPSSLRNRAHSSGSSAPPKAPRRGSSTT
ncbi:MAG TPA: hypothetical protein VEU33_10105 [Archangium sp.]|nr:hypothetical protein [Archangium sp.]